MIRNNNLSPLPFYESIDEQDYRKPWAYGNVPCLAAPCEKLLPFFFQIPSTSGLSVQSAAVIDLHTGQSAGVPLAAYLSVATLGSKKCVYYAPQKTNNEFSIPEGRYYVRVTLSDGSIYYSEVFTAVASLGYAKDYDLPGYMRITWYDDEDFDFDGGFIPYSSQYKSWLYLPTDVGMPDYVFSEEATDRDGHIQVRKQVLEKHYKFTAKAPEFMLDAMRIIRLSDHITVKDTLGRTYECDTFLVTPTWLEQGHYAKAEGEFETDMVLKKVGSGNIIEPIVPVFEFIPTDMLQSCNRGVSVILYKTTECNLTPNDIDITYEDTGDGTSWIQCNMITDANNIVRCFYFRASVWSNPDKLLRNVQVTLSYFNGERVEHTFIINQYKNPLDETTFFFMDAQDWIGTEWEAMNMLVSYPFPGTPSVRLEDGSHFEARITYGERGEVGIEVRALGENHSGLPYFDKLIAEEDGYEISSMVVGQRSS